MPPTNADYAKINIACKELGLDKSQLISDRYKKESSKYLNHAQLADLYKHFRALGWKVKRKKNGKASPIYNDKQRRKVVALWITLADEGVVKNRSNQALQRYVKRMTKVADLKWCDSGHCNILIDSLIQWAKREGIEID
jgi:phage gp16-like protein